MHAEPSGRAWPGAWILPPGVELGGRATEDLDPADTIDEIVDIAVVSAEVLSPQAGAGGSGELARPVAVAARV